MTLEDRNKAMKAMVNTPGWKLLVEIIGAEIKGFEESILNGSFQSVEELRFAQQIRNRLIDIIYTPEDEITNYEESIKNERN